jgi:Holliday junction DNA helicase RuvA
MIGQLRGTLAARLPNNHVIVDCGGVGYEVACSGYTLAALPEVDAPVTLRVFTHAQENKIALYGFFTTAERELFDYLITVKNVGPSTAMAILSGGAEPRAIAELIAKEDTAGLTKIKGVGKKTAELLVVELREKCELLLLSWNAAGGPRPVACSGRRAPRSPPDARRGRRGPGRPGLEAPRG